MPSVVAIDLLAAFSFKSKAACVSVLIGLLKSVVLSMDGIGKKAGFSTRSNFYNAFKTETGMTPSEYLETLNRR